MNKNIKVKILSCRPISITKTDLMHDLRMMSALKLE